MLTNSTGGSGAGRSTKTLPLAALLVAYLVLSLAYKAVFLLYGGVRVLRWGDGSVVVWSQAPKTFSDFLFYLLPIKGGGLFHWPSLVVGLLSLIWLEAVCRSKIAVPLFWARTVFLFPLVLIHLLLPIEVLSLDPRDFLLQFRMPFLFMDFTIAYVASLVILPPTTFSSTASRLSLMPGNTLYLMRRAMIGYAHLSAARKALVWSAVALMAFGCFALYKLYPVDVQDPDIMIPFVGFRR